MNVKVRSIALIKTLLGQAEIELALNEGATIDGLLGRLSEVGSDKLAPYLAVPKEQSAHAPLRVMVNGRDIEALQGRRTVLREGDDVLIFIPIAGG
jgi:molybdopterin converting factor small subunit